MSSQAQNNVERAKALHSICERRYEQVKSEKGPEHDETIEAEKKLNAAQEMLKEAEEKLETEKQTKIEREEKTVQHVVNYENER